MALEVLENLVKHFGYSLIFRGEGNWVTGVGKRKEEVQHSNLVVRGKIGDI